MAVRTRRLWGPTALTATTGDGSLLYTVPALRTAIIRSVWLNNAGTPMRDCQFVLNGQRMSRYHQLQANEDLFLDRWWVLNPGDVLHGLGTVVGGFRVTGFGVLLPGAPT